MTNPNNPTTKKEYSGSNIETLEDAGFESNEFATYRQWLTAGFQVQKGSAGTQIIYCKPGSKVKELDAKKDKKSKKSGGFVRKYNVFAREQVAPVEVEAEAVA